MGGMKSSEMPQSLMQGVLVIYDVDAKNMSLLTRNSR
jgi:hypothetical protein